MPGQAGLSMKTGIHPEYTEIRLADEVRRDQAKGVLGSDKPMHFDPRRPRVTWRRYRSEFFSAWVMSVHESVKAVTCME